jgi:hypothetical protein
MVTRTRTFLLTGLVVALVLAGVVSRYASEAPDGLERVAADQGIAAQEREHPLADSPLADYTARGVDDARLSGGLAGVTGVVLTLVLGGLLFAALRRRPGRVADGSPGPVPGAGPGAGPDTGAGPGTGPVPGTGPSDVTG